MKSYFTAEFFTGNRKRLKKLSNDTPLVITANSLLQRNSDMAYPFRQDSSFWYLTGINEPDFILVIDDKEEYLIMPERSQYRNIFDGGIDAKKIKNRSGIADIITPEEGWKRLRSRIKAKNKISTISAPPPFVEHYEFYSNPARRVLTEKLQSLSKNLEIIDIKAMMAELRMRKQTPEVKALKDSVSLTVKTFINLQNEITKLKFEYEVEAFLSGAFRSAGAMHGYEPIVASGLNACTLHYKENNAKLSSGSLLLVDAGAELEYYSADITRTYATGSLSKRQKEVHQAVVEVQQYVLDYLKPGISIRDSEKKSEQSMGEKLRELRLIKTNDKENVRKYFKHATSHYLGLDLHDAGDYDKPLQPGMVLTVEPGIYINEEGIGVRIEDNVLITNDGIDVLSGSLPRSLT